MSELGELNKIMVVATRAAMAAGGVLLEYFGQLDADRMQRKSSSRDLVTEADVASERILVAALREHYPEHAIEAEEEVRDEIDGDRRRWFLDPLDGTTNFVHGLPAFCVSMGLIGPDGVPLVAVVHAPMLGETFCATLGGGAWLSTEPEITDQIHVSETRTLDEAVVATGFPYRRNELPNNNLQNFSNVFPLVRGIRRFGAAALDLAWVADGRLDAYWEQHLGPHDVAAGALLVREAGGIIEDLDGGDDWLRSGHVVAGNRALASALRGQVSTRG